jgi:hypothetical protein
MDGMRQTYVEAIILGICIGLTVWFARAWLGTAGWGMRLLVFSAAGTALCLFQAWLERRRDA